MVYKVGQYPWIMLYWTRLEGDVYGLQGESATPVEVFCFVSLIVKQFNFFFFFGREQCSGASATNTSRTTQNRIFLLLLLLLKYQMAALWISVKIEPMSQNQLD